MRSWHYDMGKYPPQQYLGPNGSIDACSLQKEFVRAPIKPLSVYVLFVLAQTSSYCGSYFCLIHSARGLVLVPRSLASASWSCFIPGFGALLSRQPVVVTRPTSRSLDSIAQQQPARRFIKQKSPKPSTLNLRRRSLFSSHRSAGVRTSGVQVDASGRREATRGLAWARTVESGSEYPSPKKVNL